MFTCFAINLARTQFRQFFRKFYELWQSIEGTGFYEKFNNFSYVKLCLCLDQNRRNDLILMINNRSSDCLFYFWKFSES